MKNYHTSIDTGPEKYNYEKIIMSIGINITKNIQALSYEGCYYHKDPCYKITLRNGKSILLRIWEKGMSEGHENIARSKKGEVFISAYLEEKNQLSHLPLYGWYHHSEYDKIWGKILQKNKKTT